MNLGGGSGSIYPSVGLSIHLSSAPALSGPLLLTVMLDLGNIHKIVVHDTRMCHDLDPRPYHQYQGHSAYLPKFLVRAITSSWQVGFE